MPRRGTSHNNASYKMICPICGEIFYGKTTKAVFCSDECRRKRRSNLDKERYAKAQCAEKNCRECGMPFIPKVANEQFCSDACREQAVNRHKRSKYDCLSYVDTIPKKITPLDLKIRELGCDGVMAKKKQETIELYCRVVIDEKDKR